MTATMTLTDTLLQRKSTIRYLMLAFAGSLLITLLARVAIPLPFSPIPFTGQTLAVLLVGALFGSRLGAMTVAFYVGQGLMGLPVFAMGAGPAYVFGPTGGYLFGMIAAAYITGWFAERGWDRSMLKATVAMAAGSVAIYACGLVWLSQYIGTSSLLAAGFYPYIITDLLKIGVAASALPMGWRLLGHR